jgi:hypothetical protein
MWSGENIPIQILQAPLSLSKRVHSQNLEKGHNSRTFSSHAYKLTFHTSVSTVTKNWKTGFRVLAKTEIFSLLSHPHYPPPPSGTLSREERRAQHKPSHSH